MKSLLWATLVVFSSPIHAFAGDVEAHLKNMQNLVQSCTVVPYRMNNGVKEFQNLVSHCPEVRRVEKYRAKIKLGGKTYFAQLNESEISDGDFYDVTIRNYQSNDSYTIYNVMAFGDVLRGVLGGDVSKVRNVLDPFFKFF